MFVGHYHSVMHEYETILGGRGILGLGRTIPGTPSV